MDITKLLSLETLSRHLNVDVAMYTLIAVAGGSFLYFFVMWVRLCLEMRDVRRSLIEVLSGSQLITHAVYERISEKISNNKLVGHAWGEFDESVIRDDTEEEIQIYNTKPFSQFFRKDDLLEKRLHISSFRKIPSIVTSLGLLFTFLFIVFGLMHLVPQPSGKIDGVPELIQGLSAKFQSSVLAIFLSLIVTVLEDRLVRVLESTYQEIVDLLDRKFKFKGSEDYLRTIDKNMRELNNSMRHFGTDLSRVIKEGLSEGMRPSTDRLLVAIENLEKQKSENIADTLGKLLQEFKASLNQSTGNEFTELASNISKLSHIMNESADKSFSMQQKMDGLLQVLDDQINKQEKVSENSAARLQDSFGKLLSSVESSSRSQSEALKALTEEIVTKTSNVTSGMMTNMDALATRNANVVEGFSNLNQNLGKSLQDYMKAVEATETLIGSTGKVASGVSNSLLELTNLQHKIDQTFHQFQEQTGIVQQMQKQNVEGVTHFQKVFKEVEGGLEGVLKQIGENLGRYNSLAKEGLEKYLEQYDGSLSTATTKLSSTVKDLDEVLENLGDNIEAIRTAVKTQKAG
jgi:hypothetical protein